MGATGNPSNDFRLDDSLGLGDNSAVVNKPLARGVFLYKAILLSQLLPMIRMLHNKTLLDVREIEGSQSALC